MNSTSMLKGIHTGDNAQFDPNIKRVVIFLLNRVSLSLSVWFGWFMHI